MVIDGQRQAKCNYVTVDDLLKGHVYEDPEGEIIFVTDESSVVYLASGTEWHMDNQYDDESKFKPLKAKLVIEHE